MKREPNLVMRWIQAAVLLALAFHFTLSAGAQAAVETPQIVPSGGLSATAFEVTITCVTAGAQIYYRLEEPNATAIPMRRIPCFP